MSDVDAIEIVEHTALDSLLLNVPDDINAIEISYTTEITDISIDYVNEITNIEINVGESVQTVYEVNGLVGTVNLTYTEVLSSSTLTDGVYTNTVTHNLDYSYPIVQIYNDSGQMVISDVSIVDSNSVTIKAAINLSGYRVVVQR